ncbi:hypothetical protein SAMN05216466_106133 [Paraburkholderia phenazinium]|uniref:Uncharacterized protein n=1 Tax=Paraburkholderia phenazinium TaxID=60549 RepID=A0A1G7YCH2_9BURK|nr:hypothetical protein SAMN05216466_106133 [Paraburkholderia phenazinium]
MTSYRSISSRAQAQLKKFPNPLTGRAHPLGWYA